MRKYWNPLPGEHVMTAFGTVRTVAAVREDGTVLVYENGVPTPVRLYGDRPSADPRGPVIRQRRHLGLAPMRRAA